MFIVRAALTLMFGEGTLRGQTEGGGHEGNAEGIHTGSDGDLHKEDRRGQRKE